MDTLILSRWQFAITTIYHFFFVPLTLGLGLLVAIMQTMWVRISFMTIAPEFVFHCGWIVV